MKRKRKRQRTFKLDMEKPATGAGPEYEKQARQRVVKIKPFKASRDLHSYPVRKGQGVTINGWQFEVKTIQPNGMLYLKPIGMITADLSKPAAVLVPEDGPQEVADND